MACDVLIARSKGVFVSCRPKSPETFHLKYVGSAHVQIALFSLSDLMEMMQIHSNPTDNFRRVFWEPVEASGLPIKAGKNVQIGFVDGGTLKFHCLIRTLSNSLCR